MIAAPAVEEIRRMLGGGLSQRVVARRVGVSRGTVQAIAQGKRPDRPQPPADDLVPESGPPRRCPGCGGLIVQMPCLLCHLRARRGKA